MTTSGSDPLLNIPPNSTAPVTTPTTTPGVHAEPADTEEIYFQGSPPMRAFTGAMLLYWTICIILVAGGIWWLIKGQGLVGLKLGMIVVGLLMPLIPMLIAKSVSYRISNYRIDYERGLIAKNIDTMELWHVEDLHFHQTIFDRILNVGDITVLAKDDAMPKLLLRGIPNPRPLYEMLKQRVIAVKRQRGVIKMDPG